VKRLDGGEAAGSGRIDLYRRGCFVLEAKQSRQAGGKKEIANPWRVALEAVSLGQKERTRQ
jgi:hypothetical protein